MVAGSQYTMKRKLRSQSLCVREAVLLQQSLARTLDKLLALNPKATKLRAARKAADSAAHAARASAFPPAIAAAEAARAAVILQQAALKAKQMSLLSEARLIRQRHSQKLSWDARPLASGPVSSKTFFPTALAVRPVPALSPSPDYVTVPGFKSLQQHRFVFEADLSPPFLPLKVRQTTLCSVTLKGKQKSWTAEILAASAPWKPRWR